VTLHIVLVLEYVDAARFVVMKQQPKKRRKFLVVGCGIVSRDSHANLHCSQSLKTIRRLEKCTNWQTG
jgi:hypothetical protein